MGICAKSSELGSCKCINVFFFFHMYNSQYFFFYLSYLTCHHTSLQHLVNLFARLANDNIGYIDWDPYIPKVCCSFPLHITQLSTCLFFRILAHAPMSSLGLYVMSIAGYQANKLSGFFVELAFLLASCLCISPK